VTKERAARRESPRCSHAFNASQYSSNDEALRLMVFDKSPSRDRSSLSIAEQEACR
jgi:hypothetical protein